jgi:hypothetical protein
MLVTKMGEVAFNPSFGRVADGRDGLPSAVSPLPGAERGRPEVWLASDTSTHLVPITSVPFKGERTIFRSYEVARKP